MRLFLVKYAKKRHYKQVLAKQEVSDHTAEWKDLLFPIASTEVIRDTQLQQRAESMLSDRNLFFSFPYKTKGTDRPWNYDPIEERYWPARHYTEQKLHASDTPTDVKIVWEINRFKDLPALGVAAIETKRSDFATEVQRRIYSWIDDNPFAHSINWASGLEVAVRSISWTITLALLKQAGFDLFQDSKIKRSVWEHALYLEADLSVDKVVRSNHLIGEAAGLFLLSSLYSFPEALRYQKRARQILESEIIAQTFDDGATREATSWYHQFVTHFFDLSNRVAQITQEPLSSAFQTRLRAMKEYLAALMVPNGELIRYGDADDGWALDLGVHSEEWMAQLFGEAVSNRTEQHSRKFSSSQQVVLRSENSFAFMRAGEFGWGGEGFSSHAHEDQLSPILYLDGLPVLVDPGTFVYNGDPEGRRKYRGVEAHNGLLIGASSGAEQRLNFGWHTVRKKAELDSFHASSYDSEATMHYGEWPEHHRQVILEAHRFRVLDKFQVAGSSERSVQLFFHFHPRWQLSQKANGEFFLMDQEGHTVRIELHGRYRDTKIGTYEFSPSYRVEVPAPVFRLHAMIATGVLETHFTMVQAPKNG